MSFAVAIAASDLTQRRVAMLDHWAAMGVALLEKLASAFERGVGDGIGALVRISQAIRLAIVLATRLSDPTNPAFQPTPARARAARAAESKTAAARDPVESEARERPERDRRARVDREVSDAAILRRPLAEIVKVICRNLGIVPDWSLWTDAPEPPAAAPPPERPRPRPTPPPQRLQGVLLHRALGQRLIWTSPGEQAPPPPSLRSQLRSTASPLALDPLAAPTSGPFRMLEGC